MTSTSTNPGAIVTMSTDGSGIHDVTQRETIPLTSSDPQHINVNWDYGPVKVTGYIDLDIYNIVVLPTICGIKLGDEFSENLVDGMTIKFQIVAANGALKYYLKNGDEVWTNIDIQTTFAGTYEGDYKIITL